MTHVHLATGLAHRRESGQELVLMVASRYANHPGPLWNLPGGRQRPGELLVDTVEREVFEETGFRVRVGALAYLSESYDGDVHFINTTFHVTLLSETSALRPLPAEGDHVVDVAWVPADQIATRVSVGVIRKPLLAYLCGDLAQRYAGYHDAGITIVWPKDSS